MSADSNRHTLCSVFETVREGVAGRCHLRRPVRRLHVRARLSRHRPGPHHATAAAELVKERTAVKREASRANGTSFGCPRKVDDSEHMPRPVEWGLQPHR